MPFWMLASAAYAVSSPSELADPRNTDAWVVDQANALDDKAEHDLNAQLRGVLRDSGVEVLVVIIDHVEGDPGAFATDLFRAWGPGRVNQDRGVLVVLFNDTHSMAVNVGIGLMADMNQPFLDSLQREIMAPKLASGDLIGALSDGATAIDRQIGAAARPYEMLPEEKPSLFSRIPLWAWLVGVGVGTIGLVLGAVRLLGDNGGDDDAIPGGPR